MVTVPDSPNIFYSELNKPVAVSVEVPHVMASACVIMAQILMLGLKWIMAKIGLHVVLTRKKNL